MEHYAAIVLAGGRGSRMGTKVPKQFLSLCGKPLLWYSLRAFEESRASEIVLVVPDGEEEACRRIYAEQYGFRKITRIVPGGAERYDSVYAGLLALKDSGCSCVAIHDGARPLVTPELIDRTFKEAEQSGACVAAVPVKDTIKRADGNGCAAETLPREQLWAVQTPQTFRYELCLHSYETMMAEPQGRLDVTDDAMAVERYGNAAVRLLMGDYRNLKVTTPEDLIAAEAYLKQTLPERI